jgi:5-methylthioadenosine/S-adenosylhomocysteine deaminase
MSYILADGWVVTMNAKREILDQASILIKNNRIAEIGSRATLVSKNPECEVIDCQGSIIIPGMVNTHTHLFQTLLKGLGDDMVLKKWFTCMTGPSAVALTETDVYAAARHGCVESIRSGVTSLVDFMYAHPRPGLGAKVVEAFEETGIRGYVCRGFLTAGQEHGIPAALIEKPEQALADARALIQKQNRPGGRVQVGIAPAMIWSLDETVLRGTRALADETGALITTHVAETNFEIEQAQSRFQCTDTEFLSEIGFLGPDVLAVHCVNCSSRDIRALRHHDTKISHNPCSNMYLASGVPPIPEMLSAGLTVGLGSDGPASSNNHNLFQAMKMAALIQKGTHRDATIMTAEKVLEMATIDGARAIGLEHVIGSIEPGKKADLAVISTNHPAMAPVHNPVSAIVYSALGHEVTDVFIDGHPVLRNGVMQTVDEREVLAQSRAAADSLMLRAGSARFKSRPWRSSAF